MFIAAHKINGLLILRDRRVISTVSQNQAASAGWCGRVLTCAHTAFPVSQVSWRVLPCRKFDDMAAQKQLSKLFSVADVDEHLSTVGFEAVYYEIITIGTTIAVSIEA